MYEFLTDIRSDFLNRFVPKKSLFSSSTPQTEKQIGEKSDEFVTSLLYSPTFNM
jgi:hypothetical protein